MQSPSALPHVNAELNFLRPMAGKPFRNLFESAPGVYETNIATDAHAVAIHDARALEASPRLDVEGFEVVGHETAVDFGNEDEIASVYYRESADLVAAATGASRVVVFDHTLRRSDPDAPRRPVARAHNDYTETSGPQRVRDLMGDEAGALLGGRFAIINVWRPTHAPASHAPLAVCDARSMSEGDFVASDLVYRDRRGETYQVLHSTGQRWFYVPDMRPDEAMLIKCYDSSADGRARFTAHSAFEDPNTPPDAPRRRSIEIRTLAFFD